MQNSFSFTREKHNLKLERYCKRNIFTCEASKQYLPSSTQPLKMTPPPPACIIILGSHFTSLQTVVTCSNKNKNDNKNHLLHKIHKKHRVTCPLKNQLKIDARFNFEFFCEILPGILISFTILCIHYVNLLLDIY